MDNFSKKPPKGSFIANPWQGLDRNPTALRLLEDAQEFHTVMEAIRPPPVWSGEVPHVTLVIEHSERVASLTAHEEVPEDMMHYLLDCFQQEGLGNVRATRAEVRKINAWLKQTMMKMEADGMIWRENGKWIFEG